MNSFIGRHHIRANFYHLVNLVFVITVALAYFGVMDTRTAYVITSLLFVFDYLAMMFDPHPENSGIWYKRFFHRAFDNSEGE